MSETEKDMPAEAAVVIRFPHEEKDDDFRKISRRNQRFTAEVVVCKRSRAHDGVFKPQMEISTCSTDETDENHWALCEYLIDKTVTFDDQFRKICLNF